MRQVLQKVVSRSHITLVFVFFFSFASIGIFFLRTDVLFAAQAYDVRCISSNGEEINSISTCQLNCPYPLFQSQKAYVCASCQGGICDQELNDSTSNGYVCKWGQRYAEECAQYSTDRLNQEKAAQKTRESAIENWTCVLIFQKAPSEEEGQLLRGELRVNDKTLCLDLKSPNTKLPIQPSLDAAKSFCNNEPTKSVTYNPKPINAFLVQGLSCAEYQNLKQGAINIPFDIDALKSSAGELNKLGGISLSGLIGRLIGIAMGIIGTIALLVLIYGGLLWMTARGNSGQVEKSQKTLLWGGVGLIVILTAYAIVSFVFQAFS